MIKEHDTVSMIWQQTAAAFILIITRTNFQDRAVAKVATNISKDPTRM
jgi:hypothetical protein